MTIQAEFEKNFHSIPGIAITEKRKNLYELLNKVKSNHNEIDFAAITPTTDLEEVFKVETLIYFQKTDDLLKVLYGGNSALIKKVLSANHWFINSAFENVTGEELVTNVFPNISYNTKLKLLHKFAKFSPSAHKSDEYFEAVRNNYGLFLATRLLESCSENLILRCIEAYRVAITPCQLLTIIKKYPKITEKVLELLEKQNYDHPNNCKYRNVIDYLFLSDSSLFLKLYDLYKPDLTFGRRRTKSFILQNRDYVIKNSYKMHKILNCKQAYNSIKSDYGEYFYNRLPKSLNEFQENFEQYLNDLNQTSLLKPQQFNIIVNAFKKLFGNEFWDFPELVTFELLALMSPDDREEWMQNHTKPKNLKEETWISLMKTEKSIPLLIKKISLTSNVENRGELIRTLLSTCHINNDLNALLRVFEYVTKKHRNDDVDMRGLYLHEVSNKFDIQKFSEEHWKYLMKFVRSFLLDKSYACWYAAGLFNGYIYYSCLHKLDIYDLVFEWVKLGADIDDLCQKVPEYEKACLRIVAEVIPKIFVKKEELVEHYRKYLYTVGDYNERNPKDRMSLFEDNNAIQNLKEHLAEETYINWYDENILKKCLKYEFKRSLEVGMVELYFNKIEDKQNPYFNFILRNDPETFGKLVLPILDKYSELYHLRFLKYYEHVGLPQKFTATHVTSDNTLIDSVSFKPKEMQCLPYTMKPCDFLTLVATYCSDDLNTNCETEAEQEIYNVKKVAIASLKYLSPPEMVLRRLLQFCQGDYFNLAVDSLHSLCENLNENKIMDFVKVLNHREVSIRKHSIRLVFHLLSKKTIGEFVEKLLQNEENMSIRKCILNATFKLFLNTQEQNDFELVKQNVKAIDLKDTESFTIITNNIKKVSPKYFEEFILFIWDILENVQNPDKAIIRGKCRILSAIDESHVGSLPNEFCSRLIENYLFKSKEYDDLEIAIETFASRYIIYRNLDDLETRILSVLSIAQSYVRSNWYNIETFVTGRKFISKFVIEFSKNFLSKKCKNVEIIEAFLKIWGNLFEPSEIYNEFLHLNLTSLFIKSVERNSSMLEIGEMLGQFCNKLESKGDMNVIVFCDVLETFKEDFKSIFKDEDPNENFLVMAEGILAKNITSSGYMLAMFLLPDVKKLTSKYVEKYNNIFNQIVGQKEPNIQILLHQHFLNKLTDNDDSGEWFS